MGLYCKATLGNVKVMIMTAKRNLCNVYETLLLSTLLNSIFNADFLTKLVIVILMTKRIHYNTEPFV